MESMTLVNECPPLNRFCHDLSRFYTLFMFTTKPYMRAFLYKSAVELQKWAFILMIFAGICIYKIRGNFSRTRIKYQVNYKRIFSLKNNTYTQFDFWLVGNIRPCALLCLWCYKMHFFPFLDGAHLWSITRWITANLLNCRPSYHCWIQNLTR